jgi:hypothetical protein
MVENWPRLRLCLKAMVFLNYGEAYMTGQIAIGKASIKAQ